MPLAAGTRLGPYEIVSAIGAGGMGEVYKARDTRLERTVAVKVLPPALAADPKFRARFDREAKSISALNHPHICTLYDVGDAAGVSYLVMEHLEGETLADRLKKGPLPVDQAIDLAGQIADALDKAHRHGIVHRDLKPANVFLVRAIGASGAPHCKLLDFGLAKAVAAPGTVETRLLSTPQAANAGAPLTAQGSLLGTFQYMAPEQIEGAEADARTDIWAFGCVLYEMLTGRRAFEGKSQSSLIASILERQPTPMAELQPMTPPALSRLVRVCLEKNPDNRFHTAHDLWLHLQWIEEGGSAAGLPAPVVAGRRRRSQLIVAALIIGVAALAAATAWMVKPAPAATNVIVRFAYPLPENQRFTRTGRRMVAISPDGTKIAYIANNQIYLRQMHQLEAQPIRGTDVDPIDLTFSPDGQSLAFFISDRLDLSDAVLKRIEIAGGKPLTLCVAGEPFGASWQGNRIVFSTGSRILSVPDTAGAPETLVSSPDGREIFTRPQVVQDGKALIYTMRSSEPFLSFDDAQIVVQPLGGGPRRVLVDRGTDGRVLPTGHLTWIREGTFYARALDLRTLQLTGDSVSILENVRESPPTGAAQVAFAENGTMVFAGTEEPWSDLIWVDRSGREQPTGALAAPYNHPRVSPNGTTIVLNTNTTDNVLDLYVWDIAHKKMRKLTSGPERDLYAVWTLDGRSIVYSSFVSNLTEGDLYRRAADGTGSATRLTDSPESKLPQMVLADGHHVLVRIVTRNGLGELQVWPLDPGGKPEQVFAKPAPRPNAEVSPDRRWIAYESLEGSVRPEIHVRPFPSTDSGHWQVTSGGGLRPMWARSGRELLFQSGSGPNARLMSVAVQTGGPSTWGPPAPVLNLAKYRSGDAGRAYDISLDGQSFIMLKPVGVERDSLTIVTHWFDELRARVKAK